MNLALVQAKLYEQLPNAVWGILSVARALNSLWHVSQTPVWLRPTCNDCVPGEYWVKNKALYGLYSLTSQTPSSTCDEVHSVDDNRQHLRHRTFSDFSSKWCKSNDHNPGYMLHVYRAYTWYMLSLHVYILLRSGPVWLFYCITIFSQPIWIFRFQVFFPALNV
jgi:hypothetical protein